MNKIAISELASILVEKHGLDINEAEKFVVSMFDVINEGLHYEKQVKLKGLGTFKVTSVSARESVDVNTGERIVIEGRDKIIFVPDASMRDLVNSPFAQFETVVVSDGVNFTDIDEQNGILMDDNSADVSDEHPAQQTTDSVERPISDADELSSDQLQTPPIAPVEQPVANHVEPGINNENDAEVGGNASEHKATNDEKKSDTASSSLILSTVQLSVLNCNDSDVQPIQKDDVDNPSELETAHDETEKPSPSSVVQPAEPLGETSDDVSSDEVIEETKDMVPLTKEESNDSQPQTEVNKSEVAEEHKSEKKYEKTAKEASLEYENSELFMANDDLREQLHKSHNVVRILVVCIVLLVIAGVAASFFGIKEIEKRDKRIEHLLSQVVDNATDSVPQKLTEAETQRKADSITKAAKQEELRAEAEVEKRTQEALASSAKVNSQTHKSATDEAAKIKAAKLQVAKAQAAKMKVSKSQTDVAVNSRQYDRDPRVRTGAYNIVGVTKIITVRSGQTLGSISKTNLGPGMECYVEAINGGIKEVKAGQKIKIPKLKFKKGR